MDQSRIVYRLHAAEVGEHEAHAVAWLRVWSSPNGKLHDRAMADYAFASSNTFDLCAERYDPHSPVNMCDYYVLTESETEEEAAKSNDILATVSVEFIGYAEDGRPLNAISVKYWNLLDEPHVNGVHLAFMMIRSMLRDIESGEARACDCYWYRY
ncbi:hypothetical protein F7D09_0749 [Bifidobacterium leontopitheci]|uniref:Uncharacterized protein n=2 Tax=Bifidobacterium leontopitheci TaxID=2650774 RepID=A0A6I1GG67_9BIFI|nr:hypothetical protein F7D09_0749 [Bifidobacterium leontopitheci]